MTTGPLLIACALRAEWVALRAGLRGGARSGSTGGVGAAARAVEPGGLDGQDAQDAQAPAGIRLLRTGMGPERSGRAVRRVFAGSGTPGPGALALTGFCAAVRPGMRPGDVLVADEVRDADGTVADGSERLRAVAELADAVRVLGLRVHIGPLHSADRVVRGAEERRALAESGALGVDMETAAALRSAPPHLPAAALRVVVDTPEHELFRPSTLTGGVRAWRVLRSSGAALNAWQRALHVSQPDFLP